MSKQLLIHCWKKYLKWKENVSWNVDLRIAGRNEGRDYYFTRFGSSHDGTYANIRPVWIGDKHLRYDNVKYSQLNNFNTFLHRANFRQKFNMWVKRWNLNDVSEEATTSNFLRTKFDILTSGDPKGWARGVDTQILQDGK